MGYVFYDTETTGTNTRFDQILQFAAIKTDDDLNEVDRFEIRCRLLPNIVPSPGALRVTRVSISDLLSETRPSHFEMACQIGNKLVQWGTCKFVGWNNIRFDEEMLRQAFYQSLLPPYLTNTNGNGRLDLLKVAQLASTAAPNALTIPRTEDGRATFKLDLIAPLNDFDHRNAHDAMADVEATLHLARLLRGRARGLWDLSVRFAHKANAKHFLEAHDVFVLGESYYNRPSSHLLTLVGFDQDNPNCAIGADPAFPWEQLKNHGADALRARISRSPRPLRRIKINAAPSLLPLTDGLTGAPGAGGDVVELARRLRADEDFCRRLVAAARRPAPDPSPYLEEQIYDRFPTAADQQRMRDFHRGHWDERALIIQHFEDPRLSQIGRRLVYLHRPELLDHASRSAEAQAIFDRLIGKDAVCSSWMIIDRAEEEIRFALTDCSEAETRLMNELSEYLRDRRANVLGTSSVGK